MWNVKFLSEAEADMHSLDNSLKKQILKGIAKVSTNPASDTYWIWKTTWE